MFRRGQGAELDNIGCVDYFLFLVIMVCPTFLQYGGNHLVIENVIAWVK